MDGAGSPLPPQLHVAMLSTPGMGHIIPLAELAKKLVTTDITVTIITFAESSSSAQTKFLHALPPSITSIQLPPVNLTDIPSDARAETRMSVATARSVPAIADILLSLKSSTGERRRPQLLLAAFVADLFGADAFDAARQADVAPYLFFPSNLHLLSLLLYLPELDERTSCEYRDLPAPIELPGCVPIPGADLLDPLQDRSDECYRWMVHHGRKYAEAHGILVNTFDDLEPGAALAMKNDDHFHPPVYMVGPLVWTDNSAAGAAPPAAGASTIMDWLDGQPDGSVLYVSFGSGGTLSTEQTRELALGLEMSGERFLWVARSPSNDGTSNANYFDPSSAGDPFAFLPEGFVERTKGRGIVVPSWAPQVAVLGHAATGGFLMHCGWNSTQESVSSGVAMIAWPLYAEQRMNAVMLTEGAGVALRPSIGGVVGGGGVYRREEISEVVKELMAGEMGKKVRINSRKLRDAGAAALADGGSSAVALAKVVDTWRKAAVVSNR